MCLWLWVLVYMVYKPPPEGSDKLSFGVLFCEFTQNPTLDLGFLQHLFLMGYRTQPAYVNKPGEKAQGAKGETLLQYFTRGTIV